MRIAFVVPRFAAGVLGGAEHHVEQLAGRLIRRGHDVVVLTTCAVDHQTWANTLRPGPDRVGVIPVHRHPVSVAPDRARLAQLQTAIDAGLQLPAWAQEEWVRNKGYSEALLETIAEVADQVDALVFAPYLFASTVFGARMRPDRSLVQPLLHDEPYARFGCVQAALRETSGVLWISAGERELGERIVAGIAPGRLVGAGAELPAPPPDTQAERSRLGLEGVVVSWAGRREVAKGFPAAVEAVTALNGMGRSATLVAMGSGPAGLPAGARRYVRDLGHVSEPRMLSVFAASTAVLNLSPVESFSYVVMEAWSVGCPVIVNSACVVTRRHCEESGGGLWVSNIEEAAEAVIRLADDPALRYRLGAAGRRHVERTCSWAAVLDRFEAAVSELVAAPRPVPA